MSTAHHALLIAIVFGVSMPFTSAAAERQIMAPRVPADKLEEARALKSPLQDSPDIIEKGEALYNGKGTCFNCHGKDGMGGGPAAVGLDPSPRNFHHHGLWRHRAEGEMFWVIKHGSPGTAMVGFGNMLADEEIWTLVRYLRSFAGDSGPREGMGPRGRMGGEAQGE
jgi:mono/diheme cytochrome c family protein